MTSDVLKEFGYQVKKARTDSNLTLADLSDEMFGTKDRKGYLSQIEKGKRNINAQTIANLGEALNLPEHVTKAAMMGEAPDDAPEVAKVDRDAERLMDRVAKDDSLASKPAEALLIALAYEHADGPHRDLFDAYKSLRSALEAAEKIRERGQMAGNTGDQVAQVMFEVMRLNDLGKVDEAGEFLAQEERRLEQMQDKLFEQQLSQDRLRNRPDLTAKRLIKDLRKEPHQGGLFHAIRTATHDWTDRGNHAGDLFEMRVGLELAKANYDRAKGKRHLESFALNQLGWANFRLADRSTNQRHLVIAQNAFGAAAKKTSEIKQPAIWTNAMNGLGIVQADIGERENDFDLLMTGVKTLRSAVATQLKEEGANSANLLDGLGNSLVQLGEFDCDAETLKEAIVVFSDALALKDKSTDPLSWAGTQNNLALAQRRLATVANDTAMFETARSGFSDCEALDYQKESPFGWACLRWNIADLALARHDIDPNPAYLTEARAYVTEAREFFSQGSDYQTRRCDELIAKIEAAEAG